MNWLDQVIATPSIGVQVVPNFPVFAEQRRYLAPLLQQLHSDGVGIGIATGAGEGLIITLDTGFNLQMNADNWLVEFRYRGTSEKIAGSFRTIKAPVPRRYSEVLEEARKLLTRFTERLIHAGPHGINRIGVVSTAALDRNSLPVGVASYVENMGAPWKREVQKCQGSVLIVLDETKDREDRCHHGVTFDATAEVPDEFTLNLDWQRVWPKPRELSKAELEHSAQDACAAALQYFDAFGAGGVAP